MSEKGESKDNSHANDNKIEFKSIKRKKFQQRVKSELSDEEESLNEVSNKLEEMKELQNLRKRPKGVSVLGLALGKSVPETEISTDDPFRIETGGMINMQALKTGKIKPSNDAYDTGIGTQFSVETNKRDEDEEMMKFIEEELSKKTGKKEIEDTLENDIDSKKSYTTPEEAALQAVPTYLRESSAKRSEEMLSNQMLSGIPEVDLGIEAKIKNIEATEEAKFKLLWEKQRKKDGPSQFVPTNIAVNFVQHSRFNMLSAEIPKKGNLGVDKQDDREKLRHKKEERATDDYHYEKFKKQFRRY